MNDREIGAAVYCGTREGLGFDRQLEVLSAGDTIFVAVGPNAIDRDDAFGLDFSIRLQQRALFSGAAAK